MTDAPPKNIFLVGFMGAGKTAVGKVLAGKTGFEYRDADKIAETEAGMSVTEIFASRGEEGFRELESEILAALAKGERQVISTGGGAVTRPANIDAMRNGGVIVYLKATPETIWERVRYSKTRPLLQVENPFETVKELLSKRAPLYELADAIVITDGRTPDEITGEIISFLASRGAK
jgi:shikimate kinase